MLWGLVAASAGSVRGQDAPAAIDRPLSAERVTRRFDFEEGASNPTDLPRHWIRAQHDPPSRVRPAFPIWNQAHLDGAHAYAGAGSVRLPTRGGSASLLLDPGVVPVFPDADYVVSARVRTEGVDHARARLVARLLDASGRVLEGSEASSAPAETRGRWEPILVHLPGNESAAASLQIELLLEQPGPAGQLPFQDLEITKQDFTGAAWFDEIAVVQVPRVEVWTDWPGNLVPGGDRPRVHLFLRDLVGQSLLIRLSALDMDGALVDGVDLPFEGGRLEHDWTPALTRFGWYRIRVEVTQDGMPVGSAFTDLIWRAPASENASRALVDRPMDEFSLSVGSVPTEGLGQLGDLTLATGMGRVATELWFPGGPIDATRQEALASLANALTPVNRELCMVVPGLPPEISDVRGSTGLLAAIGGEGGDGAEWLTPLFSELGHRVRWWRFGALDETLDATMIPALPGALERVRGLVPGAVLEAPWSPFNRLDAALVAPGLVLAQPIGPAIPPSEVGRVIEEFRSLAAAGGSAGWDVPRHASAFTAPDAGRVGLNAAIDDLLRSAVAAWMTLEREGRGSSRGRSFRLDDAWRWQGGRRPQLMPSPAAAAWLTLMEMVRDRRAEGLGQIAPGLEAVLLTPTDESPSGTSSVLVVWPAAEAGASEQASLLFSRDEVAVVDRFGNRTRVGPEEIAPTHVMTHRALHGGHVAYIEGVDPDLMRFASRVRAEPAFIETGTAVDSIDLVFENPWSSAIRGKFYLVEPGGFSSGDRASRDRAWDITPRHGLFAIDAGGEHRVPVEISTTAGVESGVRPMIVDIELTSPTTSGLMRFERRAEVGLEHIEMELGYRFEDEPGGALVVFAEITNTGTERELVHVFASAPGYARQRSAPTAIGPGQRVVKAFPFENGREALGGQTVNVGLFIRETGGRLLKSVTIDGG